MSKLVMFSDRVLREASLIDDKELRRIAPHKELSRYTFEQVFNLGSAVELKNLELVATASIGEFEYSPGRNGLYGIIYTVVDISKKIAHQVGSDYHGLIVVDHHGAVLSTVNLYKSKGL